jgi:hypothetical protein
LRRRNLRYLWFRESRAMHLRARYRCQRRQLLWGSWSLDHPNPQPQEY